MTTFNSREDNVFHYLTFVTFQRVPIFKSDTICEFLIEALRETREKHLFKLIAYVIMLDHIHLIVNPLASPIEIIGKEIKGRSAYKTIKWLKQEGHTVSLNKLKAAGQGQVESHIFCLAGKG